MEETTIWYVIFRRFEGFNALVLLLHHAVPALKSNAPVLITSGRAHSAVFLLSDRLQRSLTTILREPSRQKDLSVPLAVF